MAKEAFYISEGMEKLGLLNTLYQKWLEAFIHKRGWWENFRRLKNPAPNSKGNLYKIKEGNPENQTQPEPQFKL